MTLQLWSGVCSKYCIVISCCSQVKSVNWIKCLLWQEENKILDKMHRQKVAEVEKLSTTVAELEEAVLAGGAAVNAARDYQRQVEELLVSILELQC